MALNRALRLRKSSDFQRVRQQRRSVSSRLLIIAWAPNNLNYTRFGFVVSKRISKHAVVRNYIKRLFSEAIRRVLPDLPVGLDIIISAKYQVIGTDLPTLTHDIATSLRRAKLLTSL